VYVTKAACPYFPIGLANLSSLSIAAEPLENVNRLKMVAYNAKISPLTQGQFIIIFLITHKLPDVYELIVI
jgi:uncharacterized membrane protein